MKRLSVRPFGSCFGARVRAAVVAAVTVFTVVTPAGAVVAASGPQPDRPDDCSLVDGSWRCDGFRQVIYTSEGGWQNRWVGTYAVETDEGWWKAFCLRDDLDSPGTDFYADGAVFETFDGALISLDNPTVSLNSEPAPHQYVEDGGTWLPQWDGAYSALAYYFGDGRGVDLAGGGSDVDTDAAALWIIGKWVGGAKTDGGELFVDDLFPHPSDSVAVAGQYERARAMWGFAVAHRGPSVLPAPVDADYRVDVSVDSSALLSGDDWWTVQVFNAAGEPMAAQVTVELDNGFFDAELLERSRVVDVPVTGVSGSAFGVDVFEDVTVSASAALPAPNPVLEPSDPKKQLVGASGAERAVVVEETVEGVPTGSLVVRKQARDTAETPDDLSGYVFSVAGPDGEVAGSPFTTATDGTFGPLVLPLGEYTVTELEVPSGGLLLDGVPRTVELVDDGESVEFVFDNRAEVRVDTAAVTETVDGNPVPVDLFASLTVSDTVTIAGSAGDVTESVVELHGPFDVAPAGSDCDEGSLVTVSDPVSFTGNGAFDVELSRPVLPGWYSFQVEVSRPVDGFSVTHPCGGDEVFFVPAPELSTNAFAGVDSGTAKVAAAGAVVRDEVSVSGLLSGVRYELVSELHRPASGSTVGVSTFDFVAEIPSGVAVVPTVVPADAVVGERVVFFETLLVDHDDDPLTESVVVAEHRDPDDAAQTITVVEPDPGPAGSTTTSTTVPGSSTTTVTTVPVTSSTVPGVSTTVPVTVLPQTGSSTLSLVPWAFGLLLFGSVAVGLTRRRPLR